MPPKAHPDLLAKLLGGVPVTRHQDPKIIKRTDCRRPFWFIRPYILVKTEQGVTRQQRRIPLGFCDETTMKQARVAKAEFMATVNAGKYLLQGQILFARVVELYRQGVLPTLAPATVDKYNGHLNRRILPAFANLRLFEIDRQRIQLLINTMSAMSFAARQDLRNVISAIFTYARDNNLFSGESPCRGVKLGRKATVYEKRIPTQMGLQAFLNEIRDASVSTAANTRLIVMTAVVAGLRVSEVLGLQKRDIDVNAQTLRVSRGWVLDMTGETKTESSKRVRQIGPLAVELAALVKEKPEDAFIFAGKTGLPLCQKHLQGAVLRPAAERAGIYVKGFGMHAFRRLNNSWRQEAGATPFEAQKAMGHTNPSMTYLYTVTDAGREREHVTAIWERLNNLHK
jgi:integrase